MIVWVLIITMALGCDRNSASCPKAAAIHVVDNIASAKSCEQLAKVVRQQRGVAQATCAPVQKVSVK